MNAIKTCQLTKYYGKSRGIVDLSLTVNEGDFFGFIGPNGAGKSTTIRTLLGLITQTSGSAELLGLDINKDSTEILKRVGYLPSDAAFYKGMRVKDILKLSADLRGIDCSKERNILCERLDLDINKKGYCLKAFGNAVAKLGHQFMLIYNMLCPFIKSSGQPRRACRAVNPHTAPYRRI